MSPAPRSAVDDHKRCIVARGRDQVLPQRVFNAHRLAAWRPKVVRCTARKPVLLIGLVRDRRSDAALVCRRAVVLLALVQPLSLTPARGVI
jgi:hypothetical protein